MNVIKGAMSNYRECMSWLHKYNEHIDYLFTKMAGKTTSSIISMPNGQIDPNAVEKHRNKVDDEIREYKYKNESMHNHCTNTIILCNIKFDEVEEELKEMFDMYFIQGKDIRWIERHTPFSRSEISRSINEETLRLSRL